MLPEKDGSCRPYQVGFRLLAGSAAEGFGILMPPFPQGGLPDPEPPFPQGGPQEPLAPRQESPKESCFQRRTDPAAIEDGLPAAGRECRGRARDSHPSVPVRRASGFSSLISRKEGHRNGLPLARRVRRSPASREGRILPAFHMGFRLRAGSAVEGVGILMPPFPQGGLRDSRASVPLRRATGTHWCQKESD